jgi:hypothetical protein
MKLSAPNNRLKLMAHLAKILSARSLTGALARFLILRILKY